MAKKKELCRDKRGLFQRNLGWKQTAQGYSQQKFYLGRDEIKAKIASLKLEQLWEAICRRWETFTPPLPYRKPDPATQFISNPTASPVTGQEMLTTDSAALITIGCGEIEYVQSSKPVWDEVSLTIAEAIRNAEPIVRIPLPERLGQFGLESPSVGHWLDQLRRDVPFIRIELFDLEKNRDAELQIQGEGTRLIEQGRRMTRQGGGGESLHTALTAYVEALSKKHVNLDGTVNPTGTTQMRQAEFLKDVFPDEQLVELDTARILLLQDMLALRPAGKRVARIAARSAKNYIKQFRHFLRWLNMAPGFSWKRPSDLEFTAIRIPETTQEKAAAARTARVQTYTIDEIRVLWEYASPLKRLLLLLGLNCGFDAKMIATLQPEDVYLHQKHPHETEIGCNTTPEDSWIFRLRNKTSVYGEWKLWPITVQAIEWWGQQRDQIEVAEGVTAFLVNRGGHAYDTPTAGSDRNPQLPNLWRGLTETIRKDTEHQDFRVLSFGKLRKTAGNLIRKAGDGEVAGVFLCHGQPVKSDVLLDCYTNRPYAKVFDTIDLVGQQLSPIWSSLANPFPERRKLGGSNISISLIRRIQNLRLQGYKVAYIADKLGVSQQTVSRHSSTKQTK